MGVIYEVIYRLLVVGTIVMVLLVGGNDCYRGEGFFIIVLVVVGIPWVLHGDPSW